MKKRETAADRKAERDEKRASKKTEIDSVKIPVDPVNEVVLLAAAAVLLGRDLEEAAKVLRVPADSMYGKGHSEAWAVMQELLRRKLSYDPATVRQLSAGAVDTDALDSYIEARPEPPPNLPHHIERVKWDRARVECVKGPLTAFVESLKDPNADPATVRALAKRVGGAFDGFGDKRYLRDPQALVREQSAVLTERRTGRAVFPYGIDALDRYSPGDTRTERHGNQTRLVDIAGQPRMVPGTKPGDVTTITGSSGGGKTTVTACMVLAQYEARRRVLYGAWEQGSGMTLELLAAISLGWSRTDVMIGNYTEEDQRLLEEEMERIGEFVRFFELPFGRKRGEKQLNDLNFDLIQEHISDTGADVFVADLLHLAMTEHAYGQEDDALYRMKAISLEEKCHTIQLQQLNTKKLVSEGADDRPTREAVKGTGAWIAVSDTVIGTYIPSLSKDVAADRIEFLVLKQRYGIWPQAIECEFDPEFGWIGPGKTIPYLHRGEKDEGSDLLSKSLTGGKSRFGRGKKG